MPKGIRGFQKGKLHISKTKQNWPWNKGLTKEDERVKKYTDSSSKSRRGKPNGRKGIFKHKEETKQKHENNNGA